MKRLIILALAAVAVTVTATPVANAAAPIKECGNYSVEKDRWTYGTVYGAGIFNLTTRNVTCRYARNIVTSANGMATFNCKTLDEAYEYADIRCTRKAGKVIRYQTGA